MGLDSEGAANGLISAEDNVAQQLKLVLNGEKGAILYLFDLFIYHNSMISSVVSFCKGNSLLPSASDSTHHVGYLELLRNLTSSVELPHRPASDRNEDQQVGFGLWTCLIYWLCSLWLASQSDLNAKPTRPEPEGESSSPKPQRMESPAKTDTDQRSTTHTKSDAVSQSPGSPASPVPRSKRKEGNGN